MNNIFGFIVKHGIAYNNLRWRMDFLVIAEDEDQALRTVLDAILEEVEADKTPNEYGCLVSHEWKNYTVNNVDPKTFVSANILWAK